LKLAAVSLLAIPCALSAQVLQYDWSFNEPGGSTTATDSIAGANISLLGGTSLGGGVLTLPGGAGNYAQLPNGILSSYTNSITIETWLTDNGGQGFSRAWSIGGGTAGPNNSFIGNNYIDLIPTAGGANGINGGFWTEFNHTGNLPANNVDAVLFGPLPLSTEQYVTVVLDVPHQTARTYLNGVQVGTAGVTFRPSDLGFTYNNFIGLDQYNDAIFKGSFDEMRIWNGAVPQRYISASAVAGPGVVINNLTPTSTSLTGPATLAVAATQPAIFTVTLSQTGPASLLATADATNWISSNPGVLTVDSNGMVTGMAPGTATVTAKVAGFLATSGTITVIPQMLEHRWSFSETGGNTATDSIAGANITLLGSCSLGGGVLTLPGGAGNYAQLPNGIVSSNYSITIETWLTDDAGQTWSRALSLGGPVEPPGGNFIQNNYIDLIPTAGGSGGLWTEFHSVVQGLNTTKDAISQNNIPLQTSVEKYIAISYSAPQQTCTIYSNGVPVAVATGITITPASLGTTYNNYLGLDQWNDPVFNGTYDELRIWDGALSPAQMLVSAAAGPDVVVTNTTPQTLAVSVGMNLLGSQTEQATVTGTFIQASGTLNVTSVATNWTSSNPAVLAVNTTGLITGVSGGTATVSATVGGVTATSSSITVATTAPTITRNITNQTAVIGDTYVFGVQAVGGGLSYQWSFDTMPIIGATNALLILTNITTSQAGTYGLLISNSAGTTNVSAMLTVVPPILQHEWSFNESGGSTAFDSVAGSNISLAGACSLGSGVLSLPGGNGNYAQLPNGMLSTYSNSISIETWCTDNGGSSTTWARVWSFGGSTLGPNNNFAQHNYIDLIPVAGNANGINGGIWTEFNHNNTNIDAYDPTPLPAATEEYADVTYEVWDHTVRLYLNGVQVGIATNVDFTPSDLGFTYNNFIGLDQWNDPTFNGTVDEMRIWNGAVTPLYEIVSMAAGPGVVITNVNPTSVSVSLNSSLIPGQTGQAEAVATFPQISGVSLDNFATNWVSSNPGILTVNSNGFYTAASAGSATIIANLSLGYSATSAVVTVSPSEPVITQQPAPSDTLLVGATLQASLVNIGTPPFTYSWYNSGSPSPISVSSSPLLTVPDLQSGNAGLYFCVINNNYGAATSSVIDLTIVSPTPYQQVMESLEPIAYWPLDESSGTNAFDIIGGYNGTYQGTFALGQGGPGNSFFNGSSAAAFDGTSGHVDIPEGPFNLTGPLTIVAWVDIISAPTFDGLVGHGDTSWRTSINPSGQPGGNDGTAQGDATDPIVAPGIYDGNWHMVTYTYSGTPSQNNNSALYVDGTVVANNTIATNIVGNNLDVWIGGAPDYTTRFLPADIADVSIFNRALTSTQVQGLSIGQYVQGPQFITITPSGTSVILKWQSGTLLQAPKLGGQWTTNSAATSPYTVPATNSTQFFRLLVNP
jgi:uncharacterized protein YjdB